MEQAGCQNGNAIPPRFIRAFASSLGAKVGGLLQKHLVEVTLKGMVSAIEITFIETVEERKNNPCLN